MIENKNWPKPSNYKERGHTPRPARPVAPPPIEKKINAQSRLQPTQPSEDLLLMGREVSEVRFTSCKQFVNTPLLFYSTLSAELPIN